MTDKNAREKFLDAANAKRGAVVCWGHLDCSELVALALLAAGGKDTTKTHKAQTFADETPNLATMRGALPMAGDLAFYGADWANVIHVAIHLDPLRVLSADGATRKVQDPVEAEKNKAARVNEHTTPRYRADYLGSHRNTLVDDLDRVTR